jgi:hypothetical protein
MVVLSGLSGNAAAAGAQSLGGHRLGAECAALAALCDISVLISAIMRKNAPIAC